MEGPPWSDGVINGRMVASSGSDDAFTPVLAEVREILTNKEEMRYCRKSNISSYMRLHFLPHNTVHDRFLE